MISLLCASIYPDPHKQIPSTPLSTTYLVQVLEKFAPITCLSPSTNGAFLAVGTAKGATSVFDLRNNPANPWFEVRVMGSRRDGI